MIFKPGLLNAGVGNIFYIHFSKWGKLIVDVFV
jgi:hypothetical protein